VENCFTHGFAGAFPPYSIRIDCRCSEKGWHFIIADSGCGFSQEKIHQISQEIFMVDDVLRTHRGYEKLKSQNMAILNLYIRLKLQYGEKLWFEIIRDEELGGALVKIVTEYDRKE
jgi:two-component system sensor histidine kinase YesM